ncbi:aldose 1-epimerase family protein [Youngiibacter fragilis]|uniref:Galactose mutarotase n=1 Tax=Youngiibacter fragilis 232.1 TaxID=994573 RepID=V7I4K5_9CLOT|nr:aldose 1-epimerase family protein [Youngiibacter fragilis]ETA80226.1 galactose mutarotase [Youngiibacter fragilis 232.1]
MKHTISNGKIEATFEDRGAELLSIRDAEGEEFVWQGDKKYWTYHAPHLFPVVGRLIDDTLHHEGRHFNMVRHGFARVSDFEVVSSASDTVSFRLASSDETLKAYPFRFEFFVTYRIKGVSLEVEYRVRNRDDGPIWFSVGGHPAFQAPRSEGEEFTDYYIEFSAMETLMSKRILPSGFMSRNLVSIGTMERLDLSFSLFDDDALVFGNLSENTIWLKSARSNKAVRFDFPGFPLLGIWTKTGGAPFICLEPWFGHADYEDFFGDFSRKEDNVRLDKDGEFRASFTITLE